MFEVAQDKVLTIDPTRSARRSGKQGTAKGGARDRIAGGTITERRLL